MTKKKETSAKNIEDSTTNNSHESDNQITNNAKEQNITADASEKAIEGEVLAEIKIQELEAEIASLKVNLAGMNDKYLRLSADFDNFRRRTLKEKMDLINSASEKVLTNILLVIDDFERAIQASNSTTEIEAVKEGITLIYNKFRDFTKQNGVTEIEALGKDFDTDLHEAITKIPAPNNELKGKVVDVVQKGYYLNEKVIRFAKVVIGE